MINRILATTLLAAAAALSGGPHLATVHGLCPSSGVKGFGRRFPRRPASLKEGTHVRVEEDIACA
ncbi:hypothetical protein, partial [Mycobacterium kiyosense]|uniref:hypothetical protein n=1 Tax=Mycobacterium kiyosense TaxID=2871094 RepID=UPI0022326470